MLSLFDTTRFHGNDQHVNWELVRKKSDTEITAMRLKPLWSRWGLWDQNTFCCYCSCCYCCFLSVFTELWYKGKCLWIMTTDEIQMWYLFLWYTIVLWNEAMFTLHFQVLRWIHIKDKWHNLAVRTCPVSLLHYILYLLFVCFFFSVMFEFLSFLFQRWDLTFLIHYREPLIFSTVSSLILNWCMVSVCP